MLDETLKNYINSGYRVISRKYGMISRIDRENWIEILQTKLCRETISPGDRAICWEDHYRRCFSKDVISGVPRVYISRIPNSGWDFCAYLPKISGVQST